jgi:catechol 2,3-dioxygenase-like lactoylglutathione lyase family enzyme
MVMQLDAVRIWVNDLPQAVHFYRDLLGWHFDSGASSEWAAVFRDSAIDVVVEPAGDEPELAGRFTGLSFRVEDIAQAYSTLRSAGVAFTEAPERQFWGGITASFTDPSGNQLQIVEYPK